MMNGGSGNTATFLTSGQACTKYAYDISHLKNLIRCGKRIFWDVLWTVACGLHCLTGERLASRMRHGRPRGEACEFMILYSPL